MIVLSTKVKPRRERRKQWWPLGVKAKMNHLKEKNEKEVANMCFMVINELDEDAICDILRVLVVGLRIYESKVWPTISWFEPREAIKRICGLLDAHGWASYWHITWLLSVEYSITCYTSLSCHGVDTEMRSTTMRFSWWIQSLLGDRFIWDIWWWCTWLPITIARLEYSYIDTFLSRI